MARRFTTLALACVVGLLYVAPLRAQDQPQQTPAAAPAVQTASAAKSDDPIERIKDEGMNRSQVMQTLSYLSDVIGPRLTGSPNMKHANEWTRDTLSSWGLQNAHLEAWGPFGRGWALKRFSAQVVDPQAIPLIAFPKAWTPGLKKPIVGEVVYVDAKTDADLEKYRGHLKGAIVLTRPIRALSAHFEAPGTRLTDKQLADMEAAQARGGQGRRSGPGGPGRFQMSPEMRAAAEFEAKKAKFYMDEGVALLVDPSFRGDGGTIFVQSATVPQPPDTPREKRVSPWSKDCPPIIPQIVVANEHYNRMMRMLENHERVKMAVDLDVQFYDKDLMAYNTIAEIPGTDLKDQVVMLGGHMDSWHSGTGATDNGAGVAVCMEAVRILQALHLQPRRTIRIGLWSGEEEGLFGSRAYVSQHFGSRESTASASPGGPPSAEPPAIVKKPEYDNFDVYFNLDNGTGKIRGVYLQGNEAVRPIFRDWLAPFKDMGASTLTINNTGGTDHLSFDSIGLPGFQFIQDEIEYETRTHHSNQDVFDRAEGDDLKQAATIMATFIYNAAMRDEKIPRKPVATAER